MAESEHLIRDLGLLEEIERDPDVTQAGMATQLGVAVGTVNWHLKRLIAKGYVKVKRAERRKLRYIITPEGLARRAKLTVAYIENSMALYRKARQQAKQVLAEAVGQGCTSVFIQGDGDIAEVCRLTCLEVGLEISNEHNGQGTGMIRVVGQKVYFVAPSNQEQPDHDLKKGIK